MAAATEGKVTTTTSTTAVAAEVTTTITRIEAIISTATSQQLLDE